MNNFLKDAWYKILILIMIILFGLWQGYAYVKEEIEHKNKMIEHEVDLSIYRISQQLLIESSLMEPIVKELKQLTLSQQDAHRLRDALTVHFNRSDYLYSLWLKPDRIINGIDQINPREIENNSYQAYGDSTNYVKPFYDQERSALYMPIYREFSFKASVESLIYKEVNMSDLIRDLSRLNKRYGGTGLLINDKKELIHLSRAAKISSAGQNELLTRLGEMKKVSQATLIEDGSITVIRAIGNSNWYFVYYENKSIDLGYNLLKYLFAVMVFIGIVFLIYRESVKKLLMNQRIQESHIATGQDSGQNELLQWLRLETEQINRLKNLRDSESLVAFKYELITNRISGDKDIVSKIHTREYMKWVKTLRLDSSLLEIEESTDSHGFNISAGLLHCMITATLVMIDSNLEGNVIVKLDSSSSMIIYTLYGDISRVLGNIMNQQHSELINSVGLESIHCSTVGNRLIMSVKQDQYSIGVKTDLSRNLDPKRIWNGTLYLFEDDVEECLILKFYLEKLSIHLENCTLDQEIQANSILLISKRRYLELADSLEKYETEQVHFILYGGSEDSINHEEIFIARPYSMEKIQHVLSTFIKTESR